MRKILIVCLVGLIVVRSNAQEVFSFLNIPSSAHVASVGGNMVSVTEIEDISLISQNPAISDSVSDGQLYLMYNPFIADIQKFDVFYGLDNDFLSNSVIHLNYLHLGRFDQINAFGNNVGEFSGAQYSLGLSRSHAVGGFSLGYTARIAAHQVLTDNQFAILTDIGGLYRHPDIKWSIGMSFRNFGYVFNGFDRGITSGLMDVVLGTTIKPQYMPFRFMLAFSGFTQQQSDFSIENEDLQIQERLLRYANLGASLVLSKAFEFTAGYNHLLRQELRIDTGAYGAGLSFGAIVRIKSFELHVTHTTYNAAGGATFFALQNNIQELKKIF